MGESLWPFEEGKAMFERRVKIRALAGAFAALAAMTGSNAWATTCSTSRTLTNQTCTSWRTTSSGVRYCSLWCTGSEICDNVIYGLGGNIVNGCTPGVDCPLTSCAAFGTVDLPDGSSVGDCNSDLTNLNPTCGIKGKLVCVEHEGNEVEYELISGIQGTSSDQLTCDKKGKCTNSLKLLPSDAPTLCPDEDPAEFVTFVARKFKAKSCLCPGGLDGSGTCCATADRVSAGEGTVCAKPYGNGSTTGTPTCMVSLCTVDLDPYDPVTNFNLPYDCHPDGTLECGGVTGNPCP